MNSSKPLISVIVPVYNVEKYLAKCVDSILGQTYANLEIILVEDGSPDNCGKICEEYAKKDKRIKVIHKKNGGLSDARNVAIDVAKGEYITFVDSDDYVTSDYVETLYRLVEKYQCKAGVAWSRTFHEGCDADTNQPSYQEKVFDRMDGIEKMFYQELFDTAAWCKIYHRSLFETGIRYPFGLLYEDLPTTYLLFLQADNIAFCNHIIYNYLLRPNSIEGQPFKVNKLNSALKILNIIQNHADELKPIEKAVRCRLLSFCLHILLEMPTEYPDKRKQVLIDYVKRNRWKVLTDARARKKARVGALISYIGLNTTRKILNRVKERNK
ncbi:glycosyltransferase family 2 protein [Bacteroides gallinaceum]|uniref:glycosyltransferase family 2 protein n=1 Tax=Bacteroides gallinaceum TaxID=1462571 RepID=UPI0025AB5CD7|nr:glycosyltransferase [Bacteroides gallinaceum]MDN0066649.1 glycosyltransferase [Bacteroides gallinaceum]